MQSHYLRLAKKNANPQGEAENEKNGRLEKLDFYQFPQAFGICMKLSEELNADKETCCQLAEFWYT